MRPSALFALTLALTAATAQAQPARPDDIPDNDSRGVAVAPGESCALAGVIPSLPFSTNFNNDLFAANGARGSCNSTQTALMQNDGWFVWTATYNATVTVFIDTPLYDAIVQVYSGASCASLTQLVCGDEPEPINIAFPVTNGTTYWFQVGDWGVNEGGGPTTLQITSVVLPGESCATAAVIPALPFSAAFNNDLFTADGPPGSCNSGAAVVMQNDGWYRWTATETGQLSIALDSPAYDALIQVYSGANCAALAQRVCIDEPEPIQTTIPVFAGVTYWFQTGDWGTTEGGGPTTLDLEFISTGEACDTATDIPSTPYFVTFNNDLFAADGPPGSCNSGAALAMQNDRWFRWTAPVTTAAALCVNSPAYDGIVQVYRGASCVALVPVACVDEPEPTGISFQAIAGTTYWIQIGDWGTSEGGGETDFTFLACEGDANFDGLINFDDIAQVLGNWLQVAGSCVIVGDANLDGVVDFNDVAAVLANWLGACP